MHGLPRFSKDLDFILKEPDLEFDWTGYLKKLLENLEEFGLKTEVKDKSRMDQAVRKDVLKDNSVCNQLNLSFYRGKEDQKQTIKLEIDVNPPLGSELERGALRLRSIESRQRRTHDRRRGRDRPLRARRRLPRDPGRIARASRSLSRQADARRRNLERRRKPRRHHH